MNINRELYCFELYKDYTIVIEYLEWHHKQYEGVAYIHSYHNPEYVQYGNDGEEVFNQLKRRIDESLGEAP